MKKAENLTNNYTTYPLIFGYNGLDKILKLTSSVSYYLFYTVTELYPHVTPLCFYRMMLDCILCEVLGDGDTRKDCSSRTHICFIMTHLQVPSTVLYLSLEVNV